MGFGAKSYRVFLLVPQNCVSGDTALDNAWAPLSYLLVSFITFLGTVVDFLCAIPKTEMGRSPLEGSFFFFLILEKVVMETLLVYTVFSVLI